MISNVLKSLLAVTALCPTLAYADVPSAVQALLAAGRLESLNYHSKVLDIDRQIYVYLPVEYATHPAVHYPVLYLRHGGFSDPANWIEKGDAPHILDELIHSHKAPPMIAVFTMGEMPESLGSSMDNPGLNAAGRELMEDVRPLIEAKYHTSTGPGNRAVAGLSMGAGQSFHIGQQYSHYFSAIGVFSSGRFGVVGSATPQSPASASVSPAGRRAPPPLRPFDLLGDAPAAAADPQGFNRNVPLLYISVGDQDPRAKPTIAAIELMRSKGIHIISAVQHGQHEWAVWKVALVDFASRLFKQPN